MADGLTVPFALAAGLSGAVDKTAIIVTAGLAEIAAGSIAMGLGGYLAARSDAEHYTREQVREGQEIEDKPAAEMLEVGTVLQSYGLTPAESAPVVRALSSRPAAWVDFMMRFELGLEKPDPKRALTSALTKVVRTPSAELFRSHLTCFRPARPLPSSSRCWSPCAHSSFSVTSRGALPAPAH